jgi:hypothetical protein
VADLYAGVGLFAVALAARGSDVYAVEGDPSSGEDLVANAAPWQPKIRVIQGTVEEAARRPPVPAPDVVVLDPPRTGVSADALGGLAAWGARRLVYVSCDPPTLAHAARPADTACWRARWIDLFRIRRTARSPPRSAGDCPPTIPSEGRHESRTTPERRPPKPAPQCQAEPGGGFDAPDDSSERRRRRSPAPRP